MAEKKSERGSLASDLRAMLESGEGADVVLVVGDCEIPAHGSILAARSPVFAAKLRNDMVEARSRRIEISDIREPVLRQLLSFMYKDEAPQLESMAAELLAAADKYDLPLLRLRCEQQLVRGLNVENAADTAGLAVLHSCPELKMAAVRFIAGHPEVLATAGWERLMREKTEAAAEVSEQLAVLLPLAPDNRSLTEKEKKVLSKKLRYAAEKGQTGEVRSLLEAGAPVDGKDSDGDTALHRAAWKGHAETVRCLIDAGADKNARGWNGWRPLHCAAANGHQHIVCMLIGASANVDVQNNKGDTPLHLAAKNGSVSATQALLLAGARRDIRDSRGRTPADVAKSTTRALFDA